MEDVEDVLMQLQHQVIKLHVYVTEIEKLITSTATLVMLYVGLEKFLEITITVFVLQILEEFQVFAKDVQLALHPIQGRNVFVHQIKDIIPKLTYVRTNVQMEEYGLEIPVNALVDQYLSTINVEHVLSIQLQMVLKPLVFAIKKQKPTTSILTNVHCP